MGLTTPPPPLEDPVEVLYVEDIHHDAKGQRSAIWYGNNTKTSYTYDSKTFRLRRLLTVNKNTNVILQDLNYYYDPVGNITTIQDEAQQDLFYNNSMIVAIQSFTYDALYRLVEASGRELSESMPDFADGDNWKDAIAPLPPGSNAARNYTQQYTYDEVGNILELQHIAGTGSYTRSYVYEAGNNRLTSTTVGVPEPPPHSFTNYPHDLRGNMTQMPHLSSMAWNASNELCAITKGVNTTHYQYSGGQRIRKNTVKGTVKEERIYLGSYELYRKFDSSGNINIERSTVHIIDDTGRIAMLETLNPDYNSDDSEPVLTRYVYSNHLQSASLELDEDAEIISYEEYHPYGTTSYQAMNASINAVAKRYRYTGKERDEESGLYYHGARYYAPWLCRWTVVDPINSENYNLARGYGLEKSKERHFLELTASSYEYCYDNPVRFDDPIGEQPLPRFDNEKDTKLFLESMSALRNSFANLGLEATNEILINYSNRLVENNKEIGRMSDNYGKTRLSKGKYLNAEIREMRGESPWKDQGFGQVNRDPSTTRLGSQQNPDVKFVTKDVKSLRAIGKGILEIGGATLNIIQAVEIAMNNASPLDLLPISPSLFVNPIAVERELVLLNQKLADSTVQGYSSFENYIKQLNKNTKLEEIKDLTSRLRMVFVSDSDIESGRKIDVNSRNSPSSQTSHVFLIHTDKANKNTLLHIYDYEQNNK